MKPQSILTHFRLKIAKSLREYVSLGRIAAFPGSLITPTYWDEFLGEISKVMSSKGDPLTLSLKSRNSYRIPNFESKNSKFQYVLNYQKVYRMDRRCCLGGNPPPKWGSPPLIRLKWWVSLVGFHRDNINGAYGNNF